MLGRDTADHADPVDPVQSLLFAERGEFGAQHGRSRDAELPGDGRAGGDVVAGDHPHPDVRVLGVPNSRLGFLARWVDHRDQGRHFQIRDVAQQVAGRVEGGRIDIPEGRGHHPVTLVLHPEHGILRPLPQGGVPRHASAVGESGCRAAHHGRRGALHEAAHHVPAGPVGGRVEGGHQLVGGVERQGGQPREPFPAGFGVQPRLGAQHQQGALCRVADHLAVLQLGVAGDQVRQDRVLDRRGGAGRMMDLALQAVADAGDRVAVDRVQHLDHGHLVHRQSAGLVGVDRRRRAERLHRHQFLDDGVLPGQLLGAGREDHLQDGGQRRRDRRDGQCDGRDEQGVGRLPAGQPQREHHDHRGQRGRADPQGQGVQLLGQRRLLLGRRGQHSGDLPNLGVAADGRHQHHSAAVRHRGVHEGHVHLVAGAEVGVGQRGRLLRRRRALPGQRGFVDVQRAGLDDPAVGGHIVTGGEQHQVADDDLLGRDRGLDPVPAHPWRFAWSAISARSWRSRPCPPDGAPPSR